MIFFLYSEMYKIISRNPVGIRFPSPQKCEKTPEIPDFLRKRAGRPSQAQLSWGKVACADIIRSFSRLRDK